MSEIKVYRLKEKIMRIHKDLFDYIMVVLLIFISGNIAFDTSKALLFSIFLVSLGMFFYRKRTLDVGFILFLVVLLVILISQSIKFNFLPVTTYIGVYIRILIAYFLLKSIDDFVGKFINVMYYLAIISLVFTALISIIPAFQELLINHFVVASLEYSESSQARYSILGLYTIVPSEEYKNAGPFWEMGAFGGYLILTLILSYLKDHNLKNKINIVLILTILSTQSSTAYLGFMLFLFLIFYNQTKDLLLKIIVVFLLLGSGYLAYTNLDFLGEKIESQLKMAEEMKDAPNLEGEDSQRFINMLKDWHDFQGHELIGRGPHNITRYTTMYDAQQDVEIRTVGSTDMIVRYGLPFFLWMIFLMYQSFSTYSKSFSKNGEYMGMSIVLVVLVLLSSEVYFLYPLFWIVIMLQFVYSPKERENGTTVKSQNISKFYNLNKNKENI